MKKNLHQEIIKKANIIINEIKSGKHTKLKEYYEEEKLKTLVESSLAHKNSVNRLSDIILDIQKGIWDIQKIKELYGNIQDKKILDNYSNCYNSNIKELVLADFENRHKKHQRELEIIDYTIVIYDQIIDAYGII